MKLILCTLFGLITIACIAQNVNHITIKRNNSECIIDVNNNELIPSSHYSHIWTAYDNDGKYFVVTDFKGKEGIYELGKKEVLPCMYEEISMFRNHGFVTKGEKWAVISNAFKEVSGFIFEEVSYFNNEGFALAKTNDQWVLVDVNGNIVKYLPFEEVNTFNEDEVYKKAGYNKKYGFVDRNYNVIIPFEYEDVGDEIDNMNDVFPVKKNGKWGYVNKYNRVIVPFKYTLVRPIRNGFGRIQDSECNTVGLVDAKGKVLFDDGRYVTIEDLEEGKFIYVVKDSITGERIQGYLNSHTFQIVIKAQFQACENFSNGLAIVEKNGYYGIINKEGNEVVPFKYNHIQQSGDKYLVTLSGRHGMIDRSGKIIVPLEYEDYSYYGSHTIITKGGLKGVMDRNGKILVVPKYDSIEPISDNVFYATKEGKRYLVTLDGIEKSIE